MAASCNFLASFLMTTVELDFEVARSEAKFNFSFFVKTNNEIIQIEFLYLKQEYLNFIT